MHYNKLFNQGIISTIMLRFSDIMVVPAIGTPTPIVHIQVVVV